MILKWQHDPKIQFRAKCSYVSSKHCKCIFKWLPACKEGNARYTIELYIINILYTIYTIELYIIKPLTVHWVKRSLCLNISAVLR